MKEGCFLPMCEPQMICDHYFTSADAMVRANAGDDIQKIFCSHYINCYFRNDSEKYKFVISTYDQWCVDKEYTEVQFVDFLKETYIKQGFDFLTTIKKCISTGFYIHGQCNRKYVKIAGKEGSWQYDFLIVGYDDIAREFAVYGFDELDNYVGFNMNYDDFINAFWDTPNESIEFIMRRYKKNSTVTADYEGVLSELKGYLTSTTTQKIYTGNRQYGLDGIKALSNEVRKSILNGSKQHRAYLYKFYLHKKFMMERIAFFEQMGVVGSDMLRYSEEVYTIAKEILTLASRHDNVQSLELLAEYFDKTIRIETNYLPEVLRSLDKYIEEKI